MIVCSVGCYGDRGHDGDIAGAIAGLRSVGNVPLADVMDEVSVPHAEQRHALLADIRGRNLGHLRPPVG